ncbi:MAG: serine hydrolase domain-containing protein [Vicingaceae bacterium]
MKNFITLQISLILLLASCKSDKARMQEVVYNIVEEADFNGYLYVEKNGEVIFYNTIVSPTPMLDSLNDTSKIYLASLTKLFTEVSILKLHQQGIIDLNAPISKYRNTFKPTFGDHITVLNLLKMSSGLPREIGQDEMPRTHFDNKKCAGSFLDTITDFKLSFTPGTKTEYSNLNYWILGSIIEQLTNNNLHNAFKKLIFNELGMYNSGVFNSGSPIQKGYVYSNNEWQLDTTNYEGRYASGGAYSTIEDLIKLSEALSHGKFLNPESRKYLESTNNKIEVFGSLPGYSNMFIKDFESNYTIIALNNIGLRDLSLMAKLKTSIESDLGVRPTKKSKKVVRVNPIHSLNDSIAIENSLKSWIRAVETQNAVEIFKAIENASVKGSMNREDRTWEDLSQLNKTLPKFRALGYRWVKDKTPKGIEVWFGSDSEGKLAIRWLLSEKDSSLVENLFIMPEDMTWQGKSY